MIIGLRGPIWSYGLDSIIQLFGSFIAFFVCLRSLKAYNLSKDPRFLYFGLAFALLCIDLLVYALVVPAVFIYYQFYSNLQPGILLPFSHALNFIYMFATLMAYTLFVFIYSKIDRRSIMALLGALVFCLSLFSYYYVSFIGFNISSLVLLLFVLFYTGKNYFIKKKTNPLLVFLTFILIFVAHILFVASYFFSVLSVYGHFAQLIGYLSLFVLFIRVYYGGRKKE